MHTDAADPVPLPGPMEWDLSPAPSLHHSMPSQLLTCVLQQASWASEKVPTFLLAGLGLVQLQSTLSHFCNRVNTAQALRRTGLWISTFSFVFFLGGGEK